MKRKLRIISLILSVVVSLNLCTFGVEAAERYRRYFVFSEFEEETLPDDLTYNEGSGNISVLEVGGRRAMYLDNGVDGSYTLVTKGFTEITSGEIIAEVSFMQPDVTSDGNIIIEALYKTDKVFSVVTKDGNILALKADGSYEVLMEDYVPDIWYDIKVAVNATDKACDFYINGGLEASSLAFVKSVNGIDTVSSYARFLPGFYIDDFKVSQESEYGSLEITGVTPVSNPAAGTPEYTFTATIPNEGINKYQFGTNLYSIQGLLLAGETLVWTVEGSNTAGISIEPTENFSGATLKIESNASVGNDIILKAATNGGSLSKKIKLTLEQSASDNIVITGAPRVSIYKNSNPEFKYEAKLYDQVGGEIPNKSFIWTVENLSCADISISADGVMRVSGNMPQKDERVIVRATLSDDNTVYGEKSVLVQSYDTYYNDIQRLNAAITGVDNIIKVGSNPDGRNPLIAAYVSPYTHTYAFWNLKGPQNPTPISNVTEQFQTMRAMKGITNLTGDPSYANRVNEIYQWYLDNAISRNGLVYWGNHQALDLETGKQAEHYEKYATQSNYVEVKGRDLYFDPFFELDTDAALKIIKDHWCGIINDWGTMSFNRHALWSNNRDPNYSGYNDLNNYIEYPNADDPIYPTDPFVRTTDLCFSSSSCDLFAMAEYYFKNCPDPVEAKKMIMWGYNLWKRYANTKDPDTGIFASLFNSTHRMQGRYSLEEQYGENWYTREDAKQLAGNNSYGDRAYIQFSHMLISGGYLTEEEADEELREGHLQSVGGAVSMFDKMMLAAIHMAEAMVDSDDADLQEKGREILESYLVASKSLVDIAYDFDQNKLSTFLSNGLVLDGIRWTRSGYWGSMGKTFEPVTIRNDVPENFAALYVATKDIPGFEAEKEAVWSLVKNYLDKTYHIGDIGDPVKGEKPNLKIETNSSEPLLMRYLFSLYDASGWEEYLTLARIIGNNIVKTKFNGEFIIHDSDMLYVDTEGDYHYVLLKLEAYLRGEPNLVPVSRHKSTAEIIAAWYDERGQLRDWDTCAMAELAYPVVKPTEVLLDKYDVEIKVGEEVPMTVTVMPDDTFSKAVNWDVRDVDIARVNADGSIVGIKEGETVVYAIAKSAEGVYSKPVYVKVTR